MARGINKVTLLGNLGSDPDVRYGQGKDTPITRIRVATSESWRDKQTGDRKERTEWHSVVFFGKLSTVAAEHLSKGSRVYIEGKVQTRKWQDNSGADRYTTEVIASELLMLGGEKKEESGSFRKPVEDSFQDEDIPF